MVDARYSLSHGREAEIQEVGETILGTEVWEGRPWGQFDLEPKMERGEYDHRKAQRGQNAYGAGGRPVLSDVDDVLPVDIPTIEQRVAGYKRVRLGPPRPAKVARVGLFAGIAVAVAKAWSRLR